MRGRAVVLVLCWIHSADPRWSCVVQAGRGLRSSGIWSVGVEPFALEPSTREFHFLYFYSFHPAFSFSFDFFLLILFDDFSQRSSGEILIFGHGFFRCRFFFFSAGTDDFVLWRYPTGFGYFFFFLFLGYHLDTLSSFLIRSCRSFAAISLFFVFPSLLLRFTGWPSFSFLSLRIGASIRSSCRVSCLSVCIHTFR